MNITLVSIALWLLHSASAWSAPPELPPAPRTYLHDEVGVVSAQGAQTLRTILSEHAHTTSDQIVVAVFKSLGDEDLVDHTHRIFQAWKIGSARKNNGVLVALYWAERKIRIEVGYGLEPELTDAQSRRIIDDFLKPDLKAGRVDQALVLAASEILRVLSSPLLSEGRLDSIIQSSGYRARPPENLAERTSRSVSFVLLLLIFGAWIFLRALMDRAAGDAHLSRRGWHRRDAPSVFFPVGWGGAGRRGGGGGGFGGFSGGGGRSGGGGSSGSW